MYFYFKQNNIVAAYERAVPVREGTLRRRQYPLSSRDRTPFYILVNHIHKILINIQSPLGVIILIIIIKE